MSDKNKLSQWSHKKQCLGRQGTNAITVLENIIGVYSWHPSAALSLSARVKSFTEKDFYQLESERKVLRLPAMRLSVHMLPASTAATIFAATVPAASDPIWEKRYSQPGRTIAKEHYKKWQALMLKTATIPMSVAEIKAKTDIPDEITKFLLNRMGYEGDILRVGAESLRSNIVNYVSTKAWAKEILNRPDNDIALAWLAGEYLRAFGPTRAKDFQWWAGVSAIKAKVAIAANDTTDIGDKYLLLSKDVKAYDAFKPLKIDAIDLLPQWDSYTMGYAPDGRERFVSVDMQHHIYGALGATAGNGLGTILINGMAHGSWNAKFSGSKMNITVNMFDKASTKQEKEIIKQFHELGTFLHAKTIDIQKK